MSDYHTAVPPPPEVWSRLLVLRPTPQSPHRPPSDLRSGGYLFPSRHFFGKITRKVIVPLLRSLIRFPFSGDPHRRPSLFVCSDFVPIPRGLSFPPVRCVSPSSWLLPESDAPPLWSRMAKCSPRAAPPGTPAPCKRRRTDASPVLLAHDKIVMLTGSGGEGAAKLAHDTVTVLHGSDAT